MCTSSMYVCMCMYSVALSGGGISRVVSGAYYHADGLYTNYGSITLEISSKSK